MWHDPWLREVDHLRLLGPANIDHYEMRIKNLFFLGERRWNTAYIRDTMHESHAKDILNVSLFESVKEDSVTWWPSKNGCYRVRFAYYTLLDRVIDSSHLHVGGDWNVLWRLNVPSKIKIFIWRACRKCLPMCYNLQRRGCSVLCHV